MKLSHLLIVLVLAFGFLGCTDSEAQGCFDKPSGYERDSCFLELAKARNDTVLCDMLTGSRNSCFTQVAAMAKDPAICEKIEAGYERDRCYSTVGKNTKNTTICDSITYVALKNECYYSETEPAPSNRVSNQNTYPEYSQNKKTVTLHRRQLNCRDDTPYEPAMKGQYEQVIPLVDENGKVLYSSSYTCKTRKQEQCKVIGENKTLVLDLEFDEGEGASVADSSRGLKGTVVNPVWVEGKTGKALNFQGDSYVRIPDDSSLHLGKNFLIEVWIKPTSSPETWSGSYQTIISKEWEYILRFANGHDEMGYGRTLSSIDFGAGIDNHANAYLPGWKYTGGRYAGHETSDIAVEPGNWYKLEMEYNGTHAILRMNDKIISQTQTTRNPVSGPNDLFIGSHISGIDRFTGIIDNVKIWSTNIEYDPAGVYYEEWCTNSYGSRIEAPNR